MNEADRNEVKGLISQGFKKWFGYDCKLFPLTPETPDKGPECICKGWKNVDGSQGKNPACPKCSLPETEEKPGGEDLPTLIHYSFRRFVGSAREGDDNRKHFEGIVEPLTDRIKTLEARLERKELNLLEWQADLKRRHLEIDVLKEDVKRGLKDVHFLLKKNKTLEDRVKELVSRIKVQC